MITRFKFLVLLVATGIGLQIFVAGDGGSFTWTFQQPTYLLEKDTLGRTTYTCDTSQEACKVNFDFTPSVPTEEPSTHYSCLLDFGFGVTGEENKCNPGTVEFPIGTWNVVLTVKKVADDTIVQSGTIQIVYPDGSIDPLRVTFTREWQSPTYLLLKEDASLNEYSCDPNETECKINLLVTPKLDGNNSSNLTCEITTDFELVPTTEPCNPNTSIVPTGDHILTIKILDKTKGTLLQTSAITLKNTPKDTTIDPSRVTLMREWQTPTYLLSKEDLSLIQYSCDPEEAECKINLLVTPKLDGNDSSVLTCEITSDFEFIPTTDPCNPNTSIVPEGEHILTIKILAKQDLSLLQTSTITVKNIPQDKTIDPTRVVTEIVFQQPTYLLEKDDMTRETYTCDTSQDICKVNLLVVPKLDGSESNLLSCSITSDFGFSEEDCNPDTVEIPTGEHSITIIIKNSTTGETIQTRTLNITRNIPAITGGGGSLISMLDLSVVQLIVQSGLDAEYVCKTEMCSVNFLVEVPNGATCTWDFGSGTFETPETNKKCNPGYVKFPTNTAVTLMVRDANFSNNFTTKTLHIQRLGEKNEEIEEEKPCPECSTELLEKIQISAVLPNPPHADTVEWIELQNRTSEALDLRTCIIADTTKKFALTDILPPFATLRLRQAITGLSLGNSKEDLRLECSGVVIDTFSWNFSVPEGYILRREILLQKPEKVRVSRVIDGDTIEILQNGEKISVRLLGIDTPETVHPSKPVQEFGIEASNFTKKITNYDIWLTFDDTPIDHYGRRLAYVWICLGDFSENSCTLFNEVILREGYGRMERRFPFAKFQSFDVIEKEAKVNKKGLWGLEEVKKVMSELTQEEKDALESEQEKAYLELQKELLLACEKENSTECEKKKIDWQTLTEKITTLSVSAKKSGKIAISGRTWEDFPLTLEVYNGDILLETWNIHSDEVGEYSVTWIPREIGQYRFVVSLQKEAIEVQKEEALDFSTPSQHFLTPLQASIALQGQITDNRWLDEGGIFHCRSRGSCSVNVTAETNREEDVSFLWLLPDGDIVDEKNPTPIKLGYGQYQILLIIVDDITEETSIQTLQIDHLPIPKKAKSTSSSKSKTFTLDLKDTKIEGGGVPPEELGQKSTLKDLFSSVILVMFLAGMGYWTLLIYKP